MMKICVIGGSGFIGSCLASLLSNYDLIIFDKSPPPNSKTPFLKIDIRNFKKLNNYLKDFDVVIHLAAEHADNVNPKSLYYDVNLEGTRNILKAMQNNGIKKLIFTSTVAVYGLNKKFPDENHKRDPFNDYSRSKAMAEDEILKWTKEGNSAIVVRPCVVYGPGNRGNIYNLFSQIKSGRFMMIGNGNQIKSITYVENVAQFLFQLINYKSDKIEFFNFSDSPSISINQLVEEVSSKLNVKIPKFKIPYLLGLFVGYVFDLISFFIGKKLFLSSIRVKKFNSPSHYNSDKAMKIFKNPIPSEIGIQKTLEKEFLEN